MIWNRLVIASLLGFALSAPLVTDASAQSVLRELRGATSSQITVSVNRAIVMEADRPFAELSVANPGIADIATLGERTIYVLGKTPGRTTLTILGPEGEFVSNVEVAVTPDVTEFKERLLEILPGEPIEVRTSGGGIILSGRVSGARQVSRALELAERYAPGNVSNMMMVGGSQQVMLKVRFAEMSRNVSKSLGTNLGATFAGSDATGAIFGGQTASGVATGGPVAFNTDSLGGIGVNLLDLGDFTVNLLIEALETKGMVRTLAEPNLVAVSGETADFLAGGEFPVPVDNGDNGTTIEFKEFGIQLEFTPTVIDGDLIRLELNTEVSSLQQFENGTGINTRSASTQVEMRDGQSFAIAGLLQDDFTDSVGQVPWLGDIPILGSLFRSTSFTRNQSELVIIITPHLVTPTDGDLLSMPTDRMRIPTELDLFFNGRVEGSPVVNDVARQDFQGSYGYVME
ncbi:type II and III secretion system protein family protein [Halovulum dunhuangense]|uniref:Type II and III secretion system protein family protein n=1 Tax=Halovulum dunhuangense TaxID=1505036 RepID=A0A849L4X8_9RHOB|nr:type II and III secretion system protein family protein [Halovulum dunhuangense]NNU81242.1 type II and III secretion system protein family protein [Halovulum dunhuangense]